MLGFDVRAAKIVWTGLAVLAVAWLMYRLRDVVFVLLLSLFFAYLLIPVIDFADRLRPKTWPRKLSLVATYLAVLAAAAIGITELGVRLATEAMKLEQQLPKLEAYASQYLSGPMPEELEPWKRRVVEFLRDELAASTERFLPMAKSFGQRALGMMGSALTLLLVPVFAFFFLLEGRQLVDLLVGELTPQAKTIARQLIDDIDQFLGAYIRALLVLAFSSFVVSLLFLSVARVPYALLLAALTGALEVIPVIGPFVSALTAIAVAAFSGYEHVLWIVVFFLVWRAVQDYGLQPRIFGEGIKLNPLLILIGVFAGERLAGIPGMFLSIPVMASLKILLKRTSQ